MEQRLHTFLSMRLSLSLSLSLSPFRSFVRSVRSCIRSFLHLFGTAMWSLGLPQRGHPRFDDVVTHAPTTYSAITKFDWGGKALPNTLN